VNGRRMTVSFGAVTCLEAPDTVQALVSAADQLLYAAKRAGKNRAGHRVLAAPPSPRAQGQMPLAC